MSDVESDVENVEEVEEVEVEEKGGEGKVTFEMLLNIILESNEPLSQQTPGYLKGFLNSMKEEEVPVELERCRPGLSKAVRTWNANTGKALKQGVIEYLKRCKGQMGSSFEMSFDSKVLKNLKSLLKSYKEMGITEEDCSHYVSMMAEKSSTSTSHTTAAGPIAVAGAAGGQKRKRMDTDLDEIEVRIDECPVEIENCPMFKAYSSTTAQKDGESYIKKVEVPWKPFQAKVTLYRMKDLITCPSAREQWKYKFLEMVMNFDHGSPTCQTMSTLKMLQGQDLEQKGAKWAIKPKYNFG
nr:NS2 [Mute swan feces associated ambidensovirus 3]